MRPFTTLCWTLSSELPMGCCCSNSKIQPQNVSRRTQPKKQEMIDRAYAPSKLAYRHLTKSRDDKSMRSFAFGDKRKRFNFDDESVQEESSGQEVVLEFAKDIRSYNEELAKRDRERQGLKPAKSKIPKSKGFDFPIFPPPQTQQQQQQQEEIREHYSGTASSAVASAALAAKTLPRERKYSADENSNRSQSSRLPSVHTYASEERRSGASSSRRSSSLKPQERLHYKRVDISKATENDDDEYTTLLSSEDEGDDKRGNRKQQKKLLKVNLKNMGTQYYESTYSRSKRSSFKRSSKPSSQTFTEPKMNNNVTEDPKTKRLEQHRGSALTSATSTFRRPKSKALEQRLLDAYLAQPKVLVVPLIRGQQKKGSNTILKHGGHKHRPARILKKPWRNISMNFPMLRESGLGSSNIRFATGVRVRHFEGDDSRSETVTEGGSSVRTTESRDSPRVRVVKKKLSSVSSRDKAINNFMLERYIQKTSEHKDTGRGRKQQQHHHHHPRHHEKPRETKRPASMSSTNTDEDDKRKIKQEEKDEYYALKGPSKPKPRNRRRERKSHHHGRRQ